MGEIEEDGGVWGGNGQKLGPWWGKRGIYGGNGGNLGGNGEKGPLGDSLGRVGGVNGGFMGEKR